MEDRWLARAKRLHALADTGLHFSSDAFDRERYQELREMADAMLADLGDVPLSRISDLIAPHAGGYATPSIDVRGAVIEDRRILLVQEKADGHWSLPGGFADIGHSASENVMREIAEESGLTVNATQLYALRHKAKHPYPPDVRDFYKLFFLCHRSNPDDKVPPAPGPETLNAAFFAYDQLPRLSHDRVLRRDIDAAFTAYDENLANRHFTVFD